jgi:hypothetical protein
MNETFEKIAAIESLMAAALISPFNEVLGWCANSAIAPEKMVAAAEAFRSMSSSLQADRYQTHIGCIAFGERTLVLREYPTGLFLAYLNSPVNDEVLDWLWAQVDPLLTSA